MNIRAQGEVTSCSSFRQEVAQEVVTRIDISLHRYIHSESLTLLYMSIHTHHHVVIIFFRLSVKMFIHERFLIIIIVRKAYILACSGLQSPIPALTDVKVMLISKYLYPIVL